MANKNQVRKSHTTNKKTYTQNRKRQKSNDILLQKRVKRLQSEGFQFNDAFLSYVRNPVHPKIITKDYAENFEKNISPKQLKEYAVSKKSIIDGKRVVESIYDYSDRMIKEGKEQNAINPRKFISVDFTKPNPTHKNLAIDEDYISYKNLIRTLTNASGNTPFAKYLLDVITDELPNLGVSKLHINKALGEMEAEGIILERSMLYEGDEVIKYLETLVSKLPISEDDRQLMYSIIETNEMFTDPEYEHYISPQGYEERRIAREEREAFKKEIRYNSVRKEYQQVPKKKTPKKKGGKKK